VEPESLEELSVIDIIQMMTGLGLPVDEIEEAQEALRALQMNRVG